MLTAFNKKPHRLPAWGVLGSTTVGVYRVTPSSRSFQERLI
jgi:hypothetical protein